MLRTIKYVIREALVNLKRNFTLSLASIIAIAVSLSLVGASMLLLEGVDNATARWQGGIEFIIFIEPDATAEQETAVEDSLEVLRDDNQVESFSYVDKEAAFEEFKNLFADSPELVENVTPEILPPSYRVVPADKEASAIDTLGRQFEDVEGVREVIFAFDTVQTLQNLSSLLSRGVFFTAAILLGAAALLIFNTIRTAMFSRRKEIDIMQLVGATRSFISVPFILEGLLQGIMGALLSVGSVVTLNYFFEARLSREEDLTGLLSGFVVDNSAMYNICGYLLLAGAAAGAVASGLAVWRYLLRD